MAATEISSKEEFQEAVESGVALIDFGAPWCGPCRSQEPIMESLGEKLHGRAVVAKVNIDNHRTLAASLGIQSVPTLIIFKEGKEMERFVGLQPEETLSQALFKNLN